MEQAMPFAKKVRWEDEDEAVDAEADEAILSDSDEGSDGQRQKGEAGNQSAAKKRDPKLRAHLAFRLVALDSADDFYLLRHGNPGEDLEEDYPMGGAPKKSCFEKIQELPGGGKSITFTVGSNKKKKGLRREERQKLHVEERINARRSSGPTTTMQKSKPPTGFARKRKHQVKR